MLYFFVLSWQVVMGWIGQKALIGMVAMIGLTVLFGFLHVIVYWCLVRHRELRYLRTHIIGLDIDEVLSDHREAFCRILSSETGKALDAKTITKIPVHECKGLCDRDGQQIVLNWRDEHAVFNRAAYWETMTTYEGAADTIRELKDVLNFEVIIFTYRPWPNPVTFDQTKQEQIAREWASKAWFSAWKPYRGGQANREELQPITRDTSQLCHTTNHC
jgi:hypothetical protein